MHHLTVHKGLLTIEGGISMSGVTLDMVVNLRETYAVLGSLVRSLEGTDALQIEEVGIEYHKAKALVDYLTKLYKEEKKTWATETSTDTKTH
jgi:hypothetical protein